MISFFFPLGGLQFGFRLKGLSVLACDDFTDANCLELLIYTVKLFSNF